MSSVLHSCRSCQHEFRIPGTLLGKRLSCPYCGAPNDITDSDAGKPKDPLVGQVIRGCRLERRLGAGAFGAVYAATYLKGDRPVAVKLLSSKASAKKELVQRFLREARLSCEIEHPQIVKGFDYGEERKAHYLVMELVEGTSLSSVIAERGLLPWQEAVAIGIHMADAIAYLDDQDVIHRDIKPANIMITADGAAKLADLGLGKDLADAEDALTVAGTTIGSPAYMAPEQIGDSASATPSVDVYGLGATLYHALTGQRPIEGRTSAEILGKLRKEQPPSLREFNPDIPESLDHLVLHMLAKTPSKRPQHAKEVLVALRFIQRNPDSPYNEASRVRRQIQAAASSNGKVIALVIVLLVVLGLIAAAVLLLPKSL